MIIFDLSCELGHPFEGWFQSQANYDSQLAACLIECPQCGSSNIRRIPSAVHLGKPVITHEVSVQSVESPVITSQSSLLVNFHQILSFIVANSEDVGKDFVDEARKIHYLESPLRSIRGEATHEDYENLREEGIEVMRLPIVKKEDMN